MTRTPRPSRVLVRLLRFLATREAADAAIGDMLEEMQSAPSNAALNGQILKATVTELGKATRRCGRSAGHALREALRGLRRSPAHALFILGILSVGMAAATVTFSVVDTTVLRPLPFEDGDEIVVISGQSVRRTTGLAKDEFDAIREHARGVQDVSSFIQTRSEVTTRGLEGEAGILYGTGDLFRLLRLRPQLGELWSHEHDVRDLQVAVISHRFWHERFGGDPAAIGQSMSVGSGKVRIMGILPHGAVFPGPSSGHDVDVWLPRLPTITAGPRATRLLSGYARLTPGTSLVQASAEIHNILAPHADAHAAWYPEWKLQVRRWRDVLVTGIRGWMLLALGCVVLVLVIACANAANLMLTRSWHRARELAVRAALGGSRLQLGFTLLLESLLLAIGASACALLFSKWGIGAAKAALPQGIFRADQIALDGRILAVGIAGALLTGVICGLLPAWYASRVDVLSLIKDAGVGTTRRRRWRSGFLVAQVASVSALLVVSSLFIASFVRVMTIDLGFDRSNLIGVSTLFGYPGTVDEAIAQMRGVPGVSAVAAAGPPASLPLVGRVFGGAYAVAKLQRDVTGRHSDGVEAQLTPVTPDFFDVARMRFREGGPWAAAAAKDTAAMPIVIDDITAQTLFGNEPAVGQIVRAPDPVRHFVVAGVVRRVLAQGPDGQTLSTAYYPFDPSGRRRASFLIRTSVPAAPAALRIQEMLVPILTNGHWPGVHVVDDAFARLTATRRFNAGVMSIFAVLAVLIGCAGVYAAVASAVAQRTREIGVRLALGAGSRDIRSAVLAQSARQLLLGLAIGLPAGWYMSRGFGSIFFQVAPGDITVHLAVAASVVLFGLAASLVPARRASRVNPVESLRSI